MDRLNPSGKHARSYQLDDEPKSGTPKKLFIKKPTEEGMSHVDSTSLEKRSIEVQKQAESVFSSQSSLDSDYESDSGSYYSSNDFSDTMSMDTVESLETPPPEKSLIILPGNNEIADWQLTQADESGTHENTLEGINSFRIIYQNGNPCFIFKPKSGESDIDRDGNPLSEGITVGTYYLREVVPMLFNKDEFFPIPNTYISELNGERGSCQEFVRDTESMGRMSIRQQDMSHIDKESLARLALLDIIIGNLDRHLDNILVQNGKAYGIDHGLCMSCDAAEPLKIIIPDIWQYKESLSDEALQYCRYLQSTEFENIELSLKGLGIENEAITCCRGRIVILNQIIEASSKVGVHLSVAEIVTISTLFSIHAMSEDIHTKVAPLIEELVKIKGDIDQIMISGSRAKKLRLRHRSQLSSNDFAQERIAKILNCSLEEAGDIWESLYLPTIKHYL